MQTELQFASANSAIVGFADGVALNRPTVQGTECGAVTASDVACSLANTSLLTLIPFTTQSNLNSKSEISEQTRLAVAY